MTINTRKLRVSDRDKFFTFLKNEWKKDHIFVKNPEIFDYMHASKSKKNEYNFVIVEEEKKSQIIAIHGYITPAHYDKSLSERDVFLAIWKALDFGIPGLGIRTLEYIQKLQDARLIEAINFDVNVTDLYKMLGFNTGYLSHYVLFNSNKDCFKVAKNIDPRFLKKQEIKKDKADLFICNVEAFNNLSEQSINTLAQDYFPIKSKTFLIEKYGMHPYYNYEFAVAMKNDQPVFIAVFREININKSKILRLIDFIGDESYIPKVSCRLKELLEDRDAEYIDFYFFGLEKRYLEESGFIDRALSQNLIIPNYFEPFIPQNIDLNFAVRLSDEITMDKVRLFKGHGDQDRPSII